MSTTTPKTSAEQPVDIYQTKTQGAGSSTSTAAAELVVSNLGAALGVNEAENVFATRTKGRPMILDNPRKESRSRLIQKAKLARGKEDKQKRKQNLQSGKDRLTPKATIKGLRYSTFLDIHKLWLGYMAELLNLGALASIDGPLDVYLSSHATGMQTKLVKADFHGCEIAVNASKCPNLVGSRGIVIEETANVFRIITAEDRVKVLPKQNSIFTFAIALRPEQDSSPQIQFELHGNQFRYRAEDRASRKFKHKETVEL